MKLSYLVRGAPATFVSAAHRRAIGISGKPARSALSPLPTPKKREAAER
jgi:hypothetical protein